MFLLHGNAILMTHHEKWNLNICFVDVRSIAIIVILYDCSVSFLKNHKTTCPYFIIFSVHVTVAMAQSSSDNIAIRYVLLVLWMTCPVLVPGLYVSG